MKKLSNVIIIIIVVAVGVGGFFGGSYYQKKKCASTANSRDFDGNPQQMFRGTPPTDMPGRNGQSNGGSGGGGNTGEIISKDDKSVTIKTSDGSTKIIYFSDSTTISKNETADSSNLSVGTNISAMGSTNSDKSVTAKNIIIQNDNAQ